MVDPEKQNNLKQRIMEVIDQILQSSDIELEGIKGEIWRDLSALYYKYEDGHQKRAFREVMYEICGRITESRWDLVYLKLYQLGRKERVF